MSTQPNFWKTRAAARALTTPVASKAPEECNAPIKAINEEPEIKDLGEGKNLFGNDDEPYVVPNNEPSVVLNNEPSVVVSDEDDWTNVSSKKKTITTKTICYNGPACKWFKNGTCKYDIHNICKPCKDGKSCARGAKCLYEH
jgi:hypothetical protein